MPKKKRGPADLVFPEGFPEELRPAMQDWAEDKAGRKQAYTAQGFVLLCHRVQNLGINGPRLQSLVNESIERGWKGIVEVHFDRGTGGGSAPGFGPPKKEGGAAMQNLCPEGFEEACEALYGRVPGPWPTLGDADQADIRAWIAAKKEGGAE